MCTLTLYDNNYYNYYVQFGAKMVIEKTTCIRPIEQ